MRDRRLDPFPGSDLLRSGESANIAFSIPHQGHAAVNLDILLRLIALVFAVFVAAVWWVRNPRRSRFPADALSTLTLFDPHLRSHKGVSYVSGRAQYGQVQGRRHTTVTLEVICLPFSSEASCRFLLDAGTTHRLQSDLFSRGKARLPSGTFLNDVVGLTDETERFERVIANPSVVTHLKAITSASSFLALAIVDRDDPRLQMGELFRNAAHLAAPAGDVILLHHGRRDVLFRTDEDVVRDVEALIALRRALTETAVGDVPRAAIPTRTAAILRMVMRSAALLLCILLALFVLMAIGSRL